MNATGQEIAGSGLLGREAIALEDIEGVFCRPKETAMTDHRRKAAADSKANDHPHILLLAGSRAGKGRSIILPAWPDGAGAVDPDDIDPKPTSGDSHDPAR